MIPITKAIQIYNSYSDESSFIREYQSEGQRIGVQISIQQARDDYNVLKQILKKDNKTSGSLLESVGKTAQGIASSQNISSIGYNYSTLIKGGEGFSLDKDSVFQLSDAIGEISSFLQEASENPGDALRDLFKGVLGQAGVMVQDILSKEVELRNKINSELGLTNELSRGYRNEILDTYNTSVRMFFGFDDLIRFSTNLVKDTGKMTMYGNDILSKSQITARAFYGNLDLLQKTMDSFEKVGYGAEEALKNIDKSGKNSLVLGLNVKKVLEETDRNIGKINQYGFKNGYEGLSRMTQKSIEFRTNMSEVFTLADRLFEPDKAIELSAQLQAIGGTIGDFNDPLKLMYMAVNDAEGLQDALIGVSGSLTTYNTELGKFEISGANLRRAKAMAESLGQSYEQFSNTAIKAAERASAAQDIMSSGLKLDDEQKRFLTNISRMSGGKMVIDLPKSMAEKLGLDDVKLELSKLTPTMTDFLLKNQDAFKEMSTEEIARDQYTSTQNIEADVSSILTLLKTNTARAIRVPLEKFDKYLEQSELRLKVGRIAAGKENIMPDILQSTINEGVKLIDKNFIVPEKKETQTQKTINEHNVSVTLKGDASIYGTISTALIADVNFKSQLASELKNIMGKTREYTSQA